MQEGNLHANFILQSSSVKTFQLADNRILVQGGDGRYMLKTGSVYTGWADLPGQDSAEKMINRPMPVYSH